MENIISSDVFLLANNILLRSTHTEQTFLTVKSKNWVACHYLVVKTSQSPGDNMHTSGLQAAEKSHRNSSNLDFENLFSAHCQKFVVVSSSVPQHGHRFNALSLLGDPWYQQLVLRTLPLVCGCFLIFLGATTWTLLQCIVFVKGPIDDTSKCQGEVAHAPFHMQDFPREGMSIISGQYRIKWLLEILLFLVMQWEKHHLLGMLLKQESLPHQFTMQQSLSKSIQHQNCVLTQLANYLPLRILHWKVSLSPRSQRIAHRI